MVRYCVDLRWRGGLKEEAGEIHLHDDHTPAIRIIYYATPVSTLSNEQREQAIERVLTLSRSPVKWCSDSVGIQLSLQNRNASRRLFNPLYRRRKCCSRRSPQEARWEKRASERCRRPSVTRDPSTRPIRSRRTACSLARLCDGYTNARLRKAILVIVLEVDD